MPDDVKRKIRSYVQNARDKLTYLLDSDGIDDREMADYLRRALVDTSVALGFFEDPVILQSGNLKLNKRSRAVTVDSRDVNLTSLEFDLLAYLMENSGRTISKAELYGAVWKQGYFPETDENKVNVYVSYIRKKLGYDPIQTIHGIGYMM